MYTCFAAVSSFPLSKIILLCISQSKTLKCIRNSGTCELKIFVENFLEQEVKNTILTMRVLLNLISKLIGFSFHVIF